MIPSDVAAQASDTTDPRRGLAAVAALRRVTDALELAQVESALRAGLTWVDIAAELGVTRQAVHKKFSRRVAPDLARTRK
ncbi:MAG: helix-turn-helix domain-containing protein [Propionibacteriaceae bacterium]|nr:helix-turn-helix domain-containing protein [Propionibacteriaceae bacterium]